MDFFETLDPHYAWLALGLILAVAEMAIPGVFLIWMAGAAILTGLFTWVLPIDLPAHILTFAVLAIVAVFTGTWWLRDNPIVGADPLMNQRGARLVGESALVVQAIEHGSGRIRIGDGEWIAHGPNVAAGDYVRVSGCQGAILLVEPLGLPAGDGVQSTG
jgi:membrane protein implicated in regulation of membrane protease activity